MNNRKTAWTVIIALLVVGAMLLVCCVGLFACGVLGLIPWTRTTRTTSGVISNGEQIYTTATSQSGTPIQFEMVGEMLMGGGMISCATCHGADGRGREARMMMRTYSAPDIRYKTLTAPRQNERGEEEPIFSETDIRRAITEGVEPDGESLDWPMPRWTMSAADLDDLLDYLKSLP